MVIVFPEGILVRYDNVANPELKVRVGALQRLWQQDGSDLELTLTNGTPAISENFLHCVRDPAKYDPGDQCLKIHLFAKSATTGEVQDIAQQKILAVTSLPPDAPSSSESMVRRPAPFVSIRNEFEMLIELGVEGAPGEPQRRFLVRNQFRLPVGWQAIDVFPPYDADIWKPELAPLWAECDLLAAVLQKNIREDQFRAIDPKAEARKEMAGLIAKCEGLLNGNEEPLHQFTKSDPQLLCPTHHRVWSKLALGKRETDFVFREPSGDYLLVEIEKPSHLLFRSDGQPREELTHAIDQVLDWRRYIEDNLQTVQNELGLNGISSNPACLIVIGRSASLDETAKRKLTTLQNTMPKIKIITYDEMIANAKATAENILGPSWDSGSGAQVYLLS
jgi:hypothetical protein